MVPGRIQALQRHKHVKVINILFVHANFPAQFKNLCKYLAESQEYNIKFIANKREWNCAINEEYIELRTYDIDRTDAGKYCHPYLRRMENAVLVGQATIRSAIKLNESGFTPDIIYGHSGWGGTLYLKELWPDAKFIAYFEWYYKSSGSDVGFGKQEQISADKACKITNYNAPILIDLANCDFAITPTRWQLQQFPDKFRKTINVIHDGIDTEICKPIGNKNSELKIGDKVIPKGTPLVTYMTRGFEEYRGWPQVAKGLSLLQQRNPQVHIVLVGSDEVAYGAKREDGLSWREWALNNFYFDSERLICCSQLQYKEYLKILQHSWVHVYWSIPFILSWSLLEAMSCGCALVTSDTEPIREVITPGKDAISIDFFDEDGLACCIDTLLKDKLKRESLSKNARLRIEGSEYDLKSCVRKQVDAINSLMEK